MKCEALMKRGEAQVREGHINSARTLFDLAQSAAPDDEARDAVRDRGRELGLYGEEHDPDEDILDWDDVRDYEPDFGDDGDDDDGDEETNASSD